jgi:phosphate acetyltransferase
MLDLSVWPRLKTLVEQAKRLPPTRTGVVYPLSADSLEAAVVAHREGVIDAVLYAPLTALQSLAKQCAIDLSGITCIDTPAEPEQCAAVAVSHARLDHSGPRLQALMKGSLHTDELIRPILLARRNLLRTRLSHVFAFDIPSHPKLLYIADCVVNVAPDLKVKQVITQNAIDALAQLGLVNPKVAVVAAVEGENPSIPATLDASALVKLAESGQITGAQLAGCFGLDNAISPRAAAIKGISHPVAGHADLLIVPDLNSGNILYKSLIYFAGAECAGVILGAAVPIVLTSRADSVATRVASCAMAAVLAAQVQFPTFKINL